MKKNIATITIIVAATLVAFGGWNFLNSKNANQGPLETITVGMEKTLVNSLIYIADSQKYFADNDLLVTIKDDYPSGSAAMEDLLKDKVDIVTAAELAIVRHAFGKQKIHTFGSIDRFMHQYLIARRDRGITSIPDLKGKKIGLPLKTGAEFNFSRFLTLNRIDKEQVSLVDVQAPMAVDTLMNGDVDAVVAWQPNAATLKERLGNNENIWSIHNGQPTYCAAITTNAWAKEHPKLVTQFLRSLSQAEDFVIKNPTLAKSLLQKRLNYTDAYMKTVWPEHQISLSLDQSLILTMEDEARWMIENNLTTEKMVPNFLDFIYADSLREIKPNTVKIIGKQK